MNTRVVSSKYQTISDFLYRNVVRNSLAQLIGTVAHHCDDLTEWPELLAFLERCAKSEDSGVRQVYKQ